jgi:hypothetical protein
VGEVVDHLARLRPTAGSAASYSVDPDAPFRSPLGGA